MAACVTQTHGTHGNPGTPGQNGAIRISRVACWSVVILGLLLALTTCPGCQPRQQATTNQKQAITIAGEHFSLDLALDDKTRFQGLSDVKDIPVDGGMLFVFPQPQELNFVMRKCYVPIDLIYLGPGGRIVAMHKMTVVPYDTPEADLKWYPSGWPAQMALELRAGSIDRLKLKTGQKIDLPMAELKARAR